MQSSRMQLGRLTLSVACVALTLAGCSKSEPAAEQEAAAPAANDSAAAAPAAPATTTAATPAAAAAPAADNTDTLAGVKFADFTGDAAKGATVFATCKTCHAIEEGVNKIGPSLHHVVGREAGTIPNFNYTPANKNSGITWTKEKLFQYLEKPQRVVPGTKMTFVGFSEPQKRADVIAYLSAN